MNTERIIDMPKRLDLLQHIMDTCNADSVRVVSEAGLTITLEVIINRNAMKNCAETMIEKLWSANLIGIEKINKGDTAWTETGDGLYRYTLQFSKDQ